MRRCADRRGRTLAATALGVLAVLAAAPAAGAQTSAPRIGIDTTFAPPTGIARDGEPGTGTDIPGGVAVSGDRTYTVGESNGQLAVVARRPDGSLDPGFAGDGRLDISLSDGKDVGRHVVALPDGRLRILASLDIDPSSSTNTDVAIVGLHADGSDDASFGGGDGRVSFAVGPIDDVPSRIAADAAGRLAVIGYRKDANGKEDTFVSVRNADGSPDVAFGPSGVRVIDRAGDLVNDRGVDVIFTPGGGVLGLLQVATSPDTNVNNYIAVLRALRADGADDPGFSGDGDLVLAPGEPNTIPGGLIAHRGRYWVTGSTRAGQDTDAFLARVDADGGNLAHRRFDMRGSQIDPSQAVVSGGGDLDVLPGATETLVVVGSTTYNSRTYWSAASFNALDGDLAAAGYGDVLIPTEEYGALLGVAAGNGWLAATGSLLNVNGNFDTSFGTIRLLVGTAATVGRTGCDLALEIPSPLEATFTGGAAVDVRLRVTNLGTATCGGEVVVPAPYALAGADGGQILTGQIGPGATFTAAARLSYAGPRIGSGAAALSVQVAGDTDASNNARRLGTRFPYCDLRLSAVGRARPMPTEGARRLELTVRNAGSARCSGVRLAVDRPWALDRRAASYTLDAGRSVSDVIRVRATRRVRKGTPLRARVVADGEVHAADNDVTLAPALVRVGDSNIAVATRRHIAGRATGGRGTGVAKARLRVSRVHVAVLRRAGKTCSWLAGRGGRFVRGACDRPRWLRATGGAAWSYSLPRNLAAGRYVAYSRATIAAGFAEAAFTGRDRNRRSFTAR